jgi:hypothetical protein
MDEAEGEVRYTMLATVVCWCGETSHVVSADTTKARLAFFVSSAR